MNTRYDIVVLGAGESGVSAARLARRAGLSVFVSDAGAGNAKFLEELTAAGIPHETGGHTDRARNAGAEVVVKSPGIPDTAPLVKELRKGGAAIISEIEFAVHYLNRNAIVVGITGSNGKTTTTQLTEKLLKEGGLSVLAGGNLGDSLARLLLEHDVPDVYVLELSSFQLDGIVDFRPDLAAILNITPDHLDRYEYDLAKYADSKLRIAKNMRRSERLLVLSGDETALAPALRRNDPDAFLVPITLEEDQTDEGLEIAGHRFRLEGTQLRGRHNAMNAAFAIRFALMLGVRPRDIQRGLDDFRPAPHRMEVVPTRDGRHWINDSKATNVDSTYFALDSLDGPAVWIAGGTDKGNDYDVLAEPAGANVHTLICLGADNTKLKSYFNGRLPKVVECRSMADAIAIADEEATDGDTILLSPACASFDLFKNYIDRGDQFRRQVAEQINATPHE